MKTITNHKSALYLWLLTDLRAIISVNDRRVQSYTANSAVRENRLSYKISDTYFEDNIMYGAREYYRHVDKKVHGQIISRSQFTY